LNKLIKNHLHYTNSKKASEILDNFSNYLPLFKKVMPVEYKKVLIQNFEKKQEEERA
jgi:glutamate synthase (NADPH/NADH) large chain